MCVMCYCVHFILISLNDFYILYLYVYTCCCASCIVSFVLVYDHLLVIFWKRSYCWFAQSVSERLLSVFLFFFLAFTAISLGSPFFFFCVPSYISGLHRSPSSSSAFPAISLGFTILLLLLLRSQLYLWASPFFFFFFCVPSYISGLHHSSSSSSFPSYISGVHHSSSSSAFPTYISGVHHSSSSSSAFPAISLGFTILLLLLLRSQLYLWASPFFFFFCVPSYISGVHHSSSSSSAFPAISLGFTILLLLLRSQLYLWGSPFFFFFLRSQLYLWGWPFFFFFCVPSYISEVHHSSSSSAFPAISLGWPFLVRLLRMWPFFFFF